MSKLDFGTNIIKENKQEETESVVFNYDLFGVRRTYGVVLTTEREPEEKLQIHYKINIVYLKKTNEENFIIELYKQQIFVNEKVPDSLIDQLSERCGRVLYPLQVEVTRKGVIKGIVNYKGLKERWLIERKSIQQSYSGKEVALLLENMDKVINNVIDLTALLLKRDWFFSVFFAPIYGATLNETRSYTFPFIAYAPPIPFIIKREIKKHPIKINDIVINVTGKCKDARSEHDILRGNLISLDKSESIVKGEVDLKFQIYEGNSIADAVTGFCLLEFPSGKNKRMNIEMYNLKNEIPNSRKEILKEVQNKEKEDENKLPKKKKKWFSFKR